MFVIDYMPGAMGQTVLSHILYSCSQVDIDFSNFFTAAGKAHKIGKITKSANILMARHLSRYPLVYDEKCILTVVPDKTTKPLAFRMVYLKWYKKEPDADNLEYFFNLSNNEETYTEKLESLTIKYYDLLLKEEKVSDGSHAVQLIDYLNQGLDKISIEILTDALHWHWDSDKSDQFHRHVIKNNQMHLDWFADLTKLITETRAGNYLEYNLKFWEKAILVAAICIDEHVHPTELLWYNHTCLVSNNNQNLIENFTKLKNSKSFEFQQT